MGYPMSLTYKMVTSLLAQLLDQHYPFIFSSHTYMGVKTIHLHIYTLAYNYGLYENMQ